VAAGFIRRWSFSMTIDSAVQALLGARRTHRPVPAPRIDTEADAYAVQDAVGRALGWFDGAPRYWKSGGPSRSGDLTHAPLPAAGVWTSPATVGDWPVRLRAIEAEIALRVSSDVDPLRGAGLTLDEARRLVDAMCVSIEIVESRLQDGLAAPPLSRLADLGSHGALVLGDWVPFEPQRAWETQRLRVEIDGKPPAEFTGTHALADPSYLLPGWLRHATRHGDTVPAGTVVTTGTWCGVLHAKPGDRVVVTFDGIGRAEVRF
jgi:2-keto-4-pentenoate hydratase